jgi:hypothetical protein
MPKPIMRVDGARELRATMAAAGRDLTDLIDVNKQVAATVSASAIPRVPRLTGRLASTVRPAGTKTSAIVRAGRAAVPYASVIEFGWPGHNIAAQPYLTTAAADTEPTWTDLYFGAINKILASIHGVS